MIFPVLSFIALVLIFFIVLIKGHTSVKSIGTSDSTLPSYVERRDNILTESYVYSGQTPSLSSGQGSSSGDSVDESVLESLRITLQNIKKVVEQKRSTRDYYWEKCSNVVNQYISQIQEISSSV